jgi:predicted Ser/Thr protein kinase
MTSQTPLSGSPQSGRPDRYKFIRELGRGAMGTVYLAEDTMLRRQVAMKVPHFRPGDNPELLERFHREAESAAILDHPNICPIYDVGERDGIPYLTMAFIEGQSLTDIIKRERPMDQRRAAEIVFKLARALEEAHRRGIIHRDLKPSNVMMNRYGEPVLMDFGLARRIDQDVRLTQRGSVLGTPAYMSPEQVHGDPHIGPATDVYSLGVILYEMITGQVPFLGSLGQVMSGILTQAPRPPSQLRPDSDQELEAVCLQALAKAPADRFGSMADFASALARWLQLPGQGSRSSVPEIQVPTTLATQTLEKPAVTWRESAQDKPQPAPLLGRLGGYLPLAGKVLAVLLVVALVGYGAYSLFLGGPSAAQFLARGQELLQEGKFEEALQHAQQAEDHDEPTRAAARKQVRDAALPWAEERLQARQEPGKVVALLALLEPHFPGDRELTARLGEARLLDAQQHVEGLVGKGRFKDALEKLNQPALAASHWARDERSKLLVVWAEHADRLLQDRHFLKAEQEARDLLDFDKESARAQIVRDQAGARIAEVTKEVNDRLARKEFSDAADHLTRYWPSDEKRLHGEVFKQWLAFADRQRQEKKLVQAEETLAAAATRYALDPQKKAQLDDRLRGVARARVEVPVNEALKARTLEAFKAAARAITGKEAGPLGAGERTKLQEKLEQAWLDQVRKEPAVGQQMTHLKEMLALLKSKAAEREFEALMANAALPAQITAAVQLAGVSKAHFARGRADLQRLHKRAVEEKDRRRIDTLQALLDQAEKAAADLEGPALGAFMARLARSTDLPPEDRDALAKVGKRLFGVRVEQSVAELPKQKAWEARLEDCRQAGDEGGTWVRACHVECLAELKKAEQEVKGAEWQQAVKDLMEHQPLPTAAPYALYARALAGSLGERPREEAPRLVQVFAQPKLSAELQAPHRQQRAAGVLRAAAESLRERGTFADPFGPREDADTAFAWLDLASRLAGAKADARLRRNLTLAAWHKSKPDVELVARLIPDLARKEALEELTTPEAFRFVLLHARTRDQSLAGRKDAVASYLTALKHVESLLRTNLPGADKGVDVTIVRPVCEQFHAAVIKPLLEKQGREALLTAKPDQELRDQAARLAAGSAGLIRAELPRWRELNQLGDQPLAKVVELYGFAAQQAGQPADKAEYVVLEGYAYYSLPNSSLARLKKYAELATTLDQGHPGGYGLKGMVHIREARGRQDWKDKLGLLQEADRVLEEGVKRCAKLDQARAREVLLVLYQSLGAACLELGNYSGKQEERTTYLNRGKDYLERLFKLDARNLEGWHTYGLILEDVGAFVGEPEKHYRLACQALEKAMEPQLLLAGWTRPWLARGRVQFKWAERLKGAEQDKLLEKASEDLQQAVKHAQEATDLVIAHLWRGQVHALRGNQRLAGQAFSDGLALAGKPGLEEWREDLLSEAATWALRQVAAGYRGTGAADMSELRKYLAVAEERARELDGCSKTKGGWLLLAATRWKAILNKKQASPKELEAVFARALEEEKLGQVRLQDYAWRVRLLCERARLRMEGGELPRDFAKAHADAVAAAELAARTASILPESRVTAVGLAAETAFELLVPQKEYDEPIRRLRQVVELAPQDDRACKWKASLAAALFLSEPKDPRQRTNAFEEAARNIAEAKQQTPKKGSTGLREYIENWKTAIDKKALPALQEAVADKAADKAAEAWRWHWRVAELLDASGGSRAEALRAIREAERRAPGDAPEEHLQRIRTLRGKLEQKG